MADETKIQKTEIEVDGQKQENEIMQSVDDLKSQLAAAQAETQRYKAANDKLSKEAAESKRQLRARQTQEEQDAEAQAEAQRIAEEERDNMRKELNFMKATAAYRNISNDKTITSLIEAVSEADHNAIAAIIESEKKQAVKIAEAEWLKSRPQAGGNAYSSMTKEQIMSIVDRDERMKAIAQNQALFK